MGTGIITGWVLLFTVLFASKINHIFELNTTLEENESERKDREPKRPE